MMLFAVILAITAGSSHATFGGPSQLNGLQYESEHYQFDVVAGGPEYNIGAQHGQFRENLAPLIKEASAKENFMTSASVPLFNAAPASVLSEARPMILTNAAPVKSPSVLNPGVPMVNFVAAPDFSVGRPMVVSNVPKAGVSMFNVAQAPVMLTRQTVVPQAATIRRNNVQNAGVPMVKVAAAPVAPAVRPVIAAQTASVNRPHVQNSVVTLVNAAAAPALTVPRQVLVGQSAPLNHNSMVNNGVPISSNAIINTARVSIIGPRPLYTPLQTLRQQGMVAYIPTQVNAPRATDRFIALQPSIFANAAYRNFEAAQPRNIEILSRANTRIIALQPANMVNAAFGNLQATRRPTNIRIRQRGVSQSEQKVLVGPAQVVQGTPVNGETVILNAPPIVLDVPNRQKVDAQKIGENKRQEKVVVAPPEVVLGKLVDGGTKFLDVPPILVDVDPVVAAKRRVPLLPNPALRHRSDLQGTPFTSRDNPISIPMPMPMPMSMPRPQLGVPDDNVINGVQRISASDNINRPIDSPIENLIRSRVESVESRFESGLGVQNSFGSANQLLDVAQEFRSNGGPLGVEMLSNGQVSGNALNNAGSADIVNLPVGARDTDMINDPLSGRVNGGPFGFPNEAPVPVAPLVAPPEIFSERRTDVLNQDSRVGDLFMSASNLPEALAFEDKSEGIRKSPIKSPKKLKIKQTFDSVDKTGANETKNTDDQKTTKALMSNSESKVNTGGSVNIEPGMSNKIDLNSTVIDRFNEETSMAGRLNEKTNKMGSLPMQGTFLPRSESIISQGLINNPANEPGMSETVDIESTVIDRFNVETNKMGVLPTSRIFPSKSESKISTQDSVAISTIKPVMPLTADEKSPITGRNNDQLPNKDVVKTDGSLNMPVVDLKSKDGNNQKKQELVATAITGQTPTMDSHPAGGNKTVHVLFTTSSYDKTSTTDTPSPATTIL